MKLSTKGRYGLRAMIDLAIHSNGEHVICSNVSYIAVYRLLHEYFPEKYGVEATLVDTSDLKEIRKAVRPNTKLIHIETPGNPTTRISDIEEIAKIAKDSGAMLSVDSTFASPYLQQPLKLGADLVIHSLTKYINGHESCSLNCSIKGR